MTDIQERQVVRRGVAFNRWGPWMGVAFAVLIVVSVVTGNTPESGATGTKVIDYYLKHRDLTLVSIGADVVGGVCGLLFFGYLYAWLRRFDHGWLPTVQLISAGVVVVAGLIGGGSELMLVDQAKHITPDTAKALNVVSTDLFSPISAAGVAAITVAIAVSIWSHKSASRWYAIVAIVIAVVSVVLFFTPLGLFAFVLWSLAFSIRLLLRRESLSLSGTEMRG